MPVQEGGKTRAPELTGGRGWLNTDKPLSLAALKGKVVLLDFWTYGCINCMHIIPDLKKLEKRYPNELVVIGVHSAKFENEKDTENIHCGPARGGFFSALLGGAGADQPPRGGRRGRRPRRRECSTIQR